MHEFKWAPQSFQLKNPKIEPVEGWECRSISTTEELEACMSIQKKIWPNHPFPSIFIEMNHRFEGLVLGLFTPENQLVGCCLSARVPNQKEPIHWSYRLGIIAEYQNRGWGAILKGCQKKAALKLGISRIQWAFDPLEIRNAWFNIEKLNAHIIAYEESFYQTSTRYSELGTDRFVVEWDLKKSIQNASMSPLNEGLLESDQISAFSVPNRIKQMSPEEALVFRQNMRKRFLGKNAVLPIRVVMKKNEGLYVIEKELSQ